MKKFLAILLIAVMCIGLVACGGSKQSSSTPATSGSSSGTSSGTSSGSSGASSGSSSSSSAAEPVKMTLKWSSAESEDSLVGKTVKAALEEVSEKTDGNLKFEFYFSNALGTIPEFMEQMLSGAPIIAAGGIDTASEYCHDIMPASFPYTYEDITEIFALQKTNWWENTKKALAEEHIAPVALTAFGYRNFIGSVKVEKADDLKGHIVRMGPATMAQTFMSVIGASPTTSTWSDNYSLIQNGTIDLCEAAVDLLWSSSLQEVSKYLNLSGHFITPAILMMNDQTFAQLGSEYQTILCDTLAEHLNKMVLSTVDTQTEYVQKFKDYGVEIVNTDKSSFAPYLPELYKALGFDPNLYNELRADIDAAK